jgi:hypothetical protein
MQLTIIIKELHIFDLKIINKQKNVSIKPYNLTKNRQYHMHG